MTPASYAQRSVTTYPPDRINSQSSTDQPAAPRAQKLAVIVVNYGAHRLIERNLVGSAFPREDVRVVLVDNYSGEAESRAVRKLAAAQGWALVQCADNGGFGAGVNAGVEEAIRLGSDHFVLLNPDAGMDASVAAALHAECLRSPLTMVSPQIHAPDGGVYFDGAVVDMAKTRIRGSSAVRDVRVSPQGCSADIDGERRAVMPWLTGACVAFGVDLYRRTGGMDESFFLYWEDVDFSCRARAAGATLVIRHDLHVMHEEGGTQGARRGRAKSLDYYFFNCRNRLLFAVNHVPRRHLLRWIVRTPGASWAILMQGGRRQLLDSPRVLFAALRGSGAGLLIVARAFTRRHAAPPKRAIDASSPGQPNPVKSS